MDTLPFPVRISVEVTNRCNQACLHCPRDGFTRPLGLIDPELFAEVAVAAGRHGSDLLLHFLGEPLLHPRLADLVSVAKGAGVGTVALSTNATLLDDATAAALAASGLDRLDISIDADDPDEYRRMRGVDHHARVARHVERFLRRRSQGLAAIPVVSLQFLRTSAFAAAETATVARWEPLLGEQDFIKAIVPAAFHGANPAGDQPPPGERPPCPWLFTSIVVHQDGTVAMCGADWDGAAPLGHLREASLEEIWRGRSAETRRRAHREGRFSDVPGCGDCTDWHLADGRGYANLLADRPSPLGPVAVALRGHAV